MYMCHYFHNQYNTYIYACTSTGCGFQNLMQGQNFDISRTICPQVGKCCPKCNCLNHLLMCPIHLFGGIKGAVSATPLFLFTSGMQFKEALSTYALKILEVYENGHQWLLGAQSIQCSSHRHANIMSAFRTRSELVPNSFETRQYQRVNAFTNSISKRDHCIHVSSLLSSFSLICCFLFFALNIQRHFCFTTFFGYVTIVQCIILRDLL